MTVKVTGDLNHNLIIGSFSPDSTGKIEFLGDGATLRIGQNVTFKQAHLRIESHAAIAIGDDCHIEGQLRCNLNCFIRIGRRTRLLGGSRLHAHEAVSISIGEDCILHHLRCRTSDSHKIYKQHAPAERLNDGKSIAIGDRVYAEHAVHLYKGVSIGDDCYIRSHAVLLKPVAAASYVSGIPAEVLRSGVFWFKPSAS